VHCHDLDTLYAGRQIKQRLGCALIYDAHEHYPAMVSLSLPAPFARALSLWERWLMRQVDATITASTMLRDEFAGRGVSPVVTLGNYHDAAPYDAVTEAEVRQLRERLGATDAELVVAYIGGFSPNRMLLPMIEAADSLPQVQFHLWGDGVQRAAVEQAAAGRPNVSYHGWLRSSELPPYFKAADVIFYGLRLDYPGAVYNAPNTLSCAMAAGRPIVATDVGDLGRMVRAADCGILIGEATPRAIAAAITQLLEPATRARLGANARQAARGPYNAAAQSARLVELYDGLGLNVDRHAGDLRRPPEDASTQRSSSSWRPRARPSRAVRAGSDSSPGLRARPARRGRRAALRWARAAAPDGSARRAGRDRWSCRCSGR
jgi:glycosyltransferase involved in cell wall biosynthesis